MVHSDCIQAWLQIANCAPHCDAAEFVSRRGLPTPPAAAAPPPPLPSCQPRRESCAAAAKLPVQAFTCAHGYQQLLPAEMYATVQKQRAGPANKIANRLWIQCGRAAPLRAPAAGNPRRRSRRGALRGRWESRQQSSALQRAGSGRAQHAVAASAGGPCLRQQGPLRRTRVKKGSAPPSVAAGGRLRMYRRGIWQEKPGLAQLPQGTCGRRGAKASMRGGGRAVGG